MKNKVIEELKRIASEHAGLLQPATVVEEARPVSSPLHEHFEWDDSQAAEKYRIQQARQLITVCVETLPGSTGETPIFVSLSPDRLRDKGGYRLVAQVLTDKASKEQMLLDAQAEMEVFQKKYQRLRELAAVFRAMRAVTKKK